MLVKRLNRLVLSVEALRQYFRECAQILQEHPQGLTLKAEPYSPGKTNPQLRYLHGVVYEEIRDRMREDGNDFSKEYIDIFLKEKFAYDYDTDGNKVLKSKRDFTEADMREYISRIIEWAGEELALEIPRPPEKGLENFV